MSETEGSFPMGAHVTFVNKIAWAVLFANLQWEAGSLDSAPVTVAEEQEEDLNMHFLSSASPAAIRNQESFLERIAETDNDLESQL